MTIALNIVLAVTVFAGVVGLLAYNIFAARTPVRPKARPELAKRPAQTRQRALRPEGIRA